MSGEGAVAEEVEVEKIASVGEAVRKLERKADGSLPESPDSKKVKADADADKDTVMTEKAGKGGAGGATQTTEQKLGRIMAMMEKVAVKDDLDQLETSLLKKVDATTKASITEAMDPLKSEIHDLRMRVQELKKPRPKDHGVGDGGRRDGPDL